MESPGPLGSRLNELMAQWLHDGLLWAWFHLPAQYGHFAYQVKTFLFG